MKKTVLSTISAAIIATAAFSAQANVLSDIAVTCKSGVCAVAAIPGKVTNDITSTHGAGLIAKGLYNVTTSTADGYNGLRLLGRSLNAVSSPVTWLDVPYYAVKGTWNMAKAPVKATLGAAQLLAGIPTFVVHQAYKHPVMAVAVAGVSILAICNPAMTATALGLAGKAALSATGTALDLGVKGATYGLKYGAMGSSSILHAAGSAASNIPGTAGTMISRGLSIMSGVYGAIGQTIGLAI
jgi:hypothetical protein